MTLHRLYPDTTAGRRGISVRDRRRVARHAPCAGSPRLAEALDRLRVQLLADIRALISVPFDDQPETDAQRAAVEEARQEVARGARWLTTEDLSRELGI